jgi:hypothetical protein
MNISTFRNVNFTFGYTSTNLYYNLLVYNLKKVLIIICNALNLCSATILKLFLHMQLLLLCFSALTNLYCTETLNIVLNFVIIVKFCDGFIPWFPKMWRFPYPFGFCHPVWVYGRKNKWYDIIWVEKFLTSFQSHMSLQTDLPSECLPTDQHTKPFSPHCIIRCHIKYSASERLLTCCKCVWFCTIVNPEMKVKCAVSDKTFVTHWTPVGTIVGMYRRNV